MVSNREDFTMMSKTAKKELSKTVKMPAIMRELLRYSEIECAVLCYLAETTSNEEAGSFNCSDFKQTQEMPIIEVEPSDIVGSTDVAIDDCDEVVEVALRALAPRTHISSLRLI
jgi:hypothetical protein